MVWVSHVWANRTLLKTVRRTWFRPRRTADLHYVQTSYGEHVGQAPSPDEFFSSLPGSKGTLPHLWHL